MKKILLVVSLMFGGATLVSAQQTDSRAQSQTQSETSMQQDQDGQQISVSELPDEVSAKLESQDYAGWTVGNAYKKMDESQNEMYVIELRQGTETKKVKFDRDGNKIDKDGKHKNKSESSQYRDDSQSDTETSQYGDRSESESSEYRSNTSDQDATSTQDATTGQDATNQGTVDQGTTDQASDSRIGTEDPK